jgi:hypothetical protein
MSMSNWDSYACVGSKDAYEVSVIMRVASGLMTGVKLATGAIFLGLSQPNCPTCRRLTPRNSGAIKTLLVTSISTVLFLRR